MANSDRINKNRNGQMLVPMNVDGGAYEEGFITSVKIAALIGIFLFTGAMILYVSNTYLKIPAIILLMIGTLFVDQLVLRYVVFEEKYYHKMYLKMKQYEISNPSVFWNIMSIKETDEGTIVNYADGKLGVMIKVERDTIIGKSDEFRETHYDAVSDFYKELNTKGLKFVQMNLMQQAGKDPRLSKLNELVHKSDNKNISKIVESQIGYIKKITRATLFETDYFLILSDDLNRSDILISDAIDCIYKLLGGAYISYQVCDTKEMLDLLKEQYGVKYFDYTNATVSMYKNLSANLGKPYNIIMVKYTDGTEDEVDNVGYNRILTLSRYIKEKVVKYGEWTIKETLRGNFKKGSEKLRDFKYTGYDEIIEDIQNSQEYDLDSEMFETNVTKNKVSKVALDILDDLMYGEKKEDNGDYYLDLKLDKDDSSQVEDRDEKLDLSKSQSMYLADDIQIDLDSDD